MCARRARKRHARSHAHRAQHCTIVPPKWMQFESLRATLAAEEENREEFSALPFHYLEISSLLMER